MLARCHPFLSSKPDLMKSYHQYIFDHSIQKFQTITFLISSWCSYFECWNYDRCLVKITKFYSSVSNTKTASLSCRPRMLPSHQFAPVLINLKLAFPLHQTPSTLSIHRSALKMKPTTTSPPSRQRPSALRCPVQAMPSWRIFPKRNSQPDFKSFPFFW